MGTNTPATRSPARTAPQRVADQQSAAAATTENNARNLRALLAREEARARIMPHLPGHTQADKDMAYDRLTAIIDREGRRNPEIRECTGTSVLDAAAQIVQWGLEIGSGAYLVPFNVNIAKRDEPARYEKRCTPIMGYQGMAQILIASKVVRAVEPYIVYEKEIERGDFQLYGGTDARIVHVPHWKGSDRGAPVLAYLIFRLPNNQSTFRAMSVEEIDAIRHQFSKKWKSGPCPPWWMFKCLMRQAGKFLATTPQLQKAFAPIVEEERIELSASGVQDVADELGSPGDLPALGAGASVGPESDVAVGAAREPGEEYQDDRDLDDSGYGR